MYTFYVEHNTYDSGVAIFLKLGNRKLLKIVFFNIPNTTILFMGNTKLF